MEFLARVREEWDDFNDFTEKHLRIPAGIASLVGAAFILFTLTVGYWLFNYGPLSEGTDPSHQRTIAQPVTPQQAEPAREDPFPGVAWVDPVTAVQLRKQPNVVNFVWLKDGSAQYAPDFSMTFDQNQHGWKEALNNADLHDVTFGTTPTSVHFTAGEAEYEVNLYQPFVVGSGKPLVVYMFALNDRHEAELYQTSDFTKDRLDEVQAHLPQQVAPDPDLTLTKGR